MERIIPDGSATGRTKMITDAQASRRLAHRHDAIKAWEGQVGVVLGDFKEPDNAVHETPEDLESHTEAAPWELEREVGHRLLAGEIDAVEAFRLLG